VNDETIRDGLSGAPHLNCIHRPPMQVVQQALIDDVDDVLDARAKRLFGQAI
jgi:hypothetical protein